MEAAAAEAVAGVEALLERTDNPRYAQRQAQARRSPDVLVREQFHLVVACTIAALMLY